MSRKASVAGLLVTAMLGVPVAAHADSLLGFHAGGFFLRGEDGRTDGDVLVENLSFRTLIDGDFDEPLSVFNGATFSGEYLFGIGDFIEAGVGVGYYQQDEASYLLAISRKSTGPTSTRTPRSGSSPSRSACAPSRSAGRRPCSPTSAPA